MTTLGVLTLLALCAPTFSVYASIVAELTAEVEALLAISIQLGISFPELAIVLEVLVDLALQLDLAISVQVPSLNAEFGVSISVELALLLGIVAILEAAVDVGAVGGIEVLTYGGIGADFGGAISSSVPAGDVTALILGATSSVAFAALSGFFDGATFSGGVTDLGDLTLSAVLAADFELLAGLLGEFKARANAAIKAEARIAFLPPSVSASYEIVVEAAAKVRAALALIMPSVSASFLASIEARIALIGQLAAQITAELSFATDGFDAFVYQGPGAGLGPALTGKLSGGWPDGAAANQDARAIVLVATTPEASAALSTFFPPVAA